MTKVRMVQVTISTNWKLMAPASSVRSMAVMPTLTIIAGRNTPVTRSEAQARRSIKYCGMMLTALRMMQSRISQTM